MTCWAFLVLSCLILPVLTTDPAVLIVSFDGFRHDYFDRVSSPNFDRLKRRGSHGDIMNVFETKTFPNHQSLATGLYPESHGVLANHVFDPNYNRTVNYSIELWQYNDQIMPIWTLNEMSGVDRNSGVMMWPGSEFSYHKAVLPTFIQKWDPRWTWQQRVDMVMSWLTHPHNPANLVMLYMEEPDTHAHAFGSESAEVTEQIKNVDRYIGYLVDQLERHNLTEAVNTFVLSDHGMTETDVHRIIDLNEFTDNSTYLRVGTSPVVHIFPHPGQQHTLLLQFEWAAHQYKTFQVFTNDNIPSHWKVTNCRRAPPILLVANEGYAFDDLRESIVEYGKKYNFTPTVNHKYGLHGYDNLLRSMQPFFVAFGPSIREDFTIPQIHSIDLFSLWTEMLKLPQQTTNGTLSAETLQMLRVHHISPSLSSLLITCKNCMSQSCVCMRESCHRHNRRHRDNCDQAANQEAQHR
ncbi:bis(5'-adenosyl)-triphosphatase enpp4-like isoform X2 [Neocloeon triangulifer]|uniref:bis(5'-adenosyl)-triphosphatase enpp4-like isoform X2 n=1 Tax=Neocloeon triangulifer TaxID=2078957 RepID=UPI00286F499F|nr:bis(5'-adenosyl)-triphosphatase enpp4-like isoform X2 [Neocloeon triangulifer]